MRSVPLPFLSKITLLWTRAREPGPVSPVKVDSPLPFPWTQRGEIYSGGSLDLLIELAITFDISLDYLILGRVKYSDSERIQRELENIMGQIGQLKASL